MSEPTIDPTLEVLRTQLAQIEDAYAAYSGSLAWAKAEAGIDPGAAELAWMEDNREQCRQLEQRLDARIAQLRAQGIEVPPMPSRWERSVEEAARRAPPVQIVASAAATPAHPPVWTLDPAALDTVFPPAPLDHALGAVMSRRVRLVEMRAIASLSLPFGWREREPEDGVRAGDSLREFAPAADPAACICVYARGRQMGPLAGQEFRALLAQAPHTLSGEEREANSMPIRDASDDTWFDMHSWITASVNGRTVQVVRGMWKRSGLHDLAITVDGGNGGRRVEEFHYLAKMPNFLRHHAAARRAVAGLRWRMPQD